MEINGENNEDSLFIFYVISEWEDLRWKRAFLLRYHIPASHMFMPCRYNGKIILCRKRKRKIVRREKLRAEMGGKGMESLNESFSSSFRLFPIVT